MLGLSGHGPGLSLAWDIRGKPIGGQNNPLEAYHRLFAKDKTPIAEQQAMLAQRRSVLDTVQEKRPRFEAPPWEERQCQAGRIL